MDQWSASSIELKVIDLPGTVYEPMISCQASALTYVVIKYIPVRTCICILCTCGEVLESSEPTMPRDQMLYFAEDPVSPIRGNKVNARLLGSGCIPFIKYGKQVPTQRFAMVSSSNTSLRARFLRLEHMDIYVAS